LTNKDNKKTKEELEDEEFNEPNATLFVKNLNFDTTEENLQTV
jgi:RNA recognition motif-containing protein